MERLRDIVASRRAVVGVVLFDGFELLDVFGPLELLASANARCHALSFVYIKLDASNDSDSGGGGDDGGYNDASLRVQPTEGPVTLADVCVRAAHDMSHPIPTLDVLFVPGGRGVQAIVESDSLLGAVRHLVQGTCAALSVCTGATVLAAAGVLDGLDATTNKRAFGNAATRYPTVRWVCEARWCVATKTPPAAGAATAAKQAGGKHPRDAGEDATAATTAAASAATTPPPVVFTASGVSAGLDMTAEFLAQLTNEHSAEQACRAAEYTANRDPSNDPFAAAARDSHSIGAAEAAAAASAVKGLPSAQQPLKLAVVLYDNFEMLDTFGPLEFFGMANKILAENQPCRAFKLITLAEERTVKSWGGPAFCVDQLIGSFDMDGEAEGEGECGSGGNGHGTGQGQGTGEEERETTGRKTGRRSHEKSNAGSASTTPPLFDILFVPGGVGTLREVNNPVMRRFLSAVVPRCRRVMTVCTGASMLAQTGALDGLPATTNKLAFDLFITYGPLVKWQAAARWAVDPGRRFYTSSGVSAGMDLAVVLLAELFGLPFAKAAAQRAEYTPNLDADNDPFCSDIPPASGARRLAVRLQKLALSAIFSAGFALGMPMLSITPLLMPSE
eukprot:m.494686 g.494686  ORF g.494686 m.494686 type:complete len:617 (+) comp41480_c0_seq1:157-2007(+)